MTHELPQFLREMLNAPPAAGEGVHDWLFRVARHLHAHIPAGEIVNILEARVKGCGRPVSRKEIEDAVKNSIPCAWQRIGTNAPAQTGGKWPTVNQRQRAAIIRDSGGLAELWESSPVQIEDNRGHTEEIINHLFPMEALLCCGKSSTDFDTKPRQDWRGELMQLQLIVPSPMTARTGLTIGGKESARALSNTGPRRFLICEFDTGTIDEQAALQMHLAKYAPLVCVVHSGGKSLHGWFLAAGWLDAKVEKFFRYAVSLGADRATWTPCQFVRMPDGKRDNGKKQSVYFLNFQPLKTHEQPPCK
jgi:hypothetical protein